MTSGMSGTTVSDVVAVVATEGEAMRGGGGGTGEGGKWKA